MKEAKCPFCGKELVHDYTSWEIKESGNDYAVIEAKIWLGCEKCNVRVTRIIRKEVKL